MFERFTDRARRAVVLAQEEARMLHHSYIGTEHVLLGITHEGEGVGATALESLGVSVETVRESVEAVIGRGKEAPSGHIPFTERAKKVLELSLREALDLEHNYIGTEHILLGLLREGGGVAAHVLVRLDAELGSVREKVMELLRHHAADRPTEVQLPGVHRYGPDTRRVLVLAQEEARFLAHDHIGAEHLLLGILREGESAGALSLHRAGHTLQALRDAARQNGPLSDLASQGTYAFSPEAGEAQRTALTWSNRLGAPQISAAHLLLGLLPDAETALAQFLQAQGTAPDELRQATVQLLWFVATVEPPNKRAQWENTPPDRTEQFTTELDSVIELAREEAGGMRHDHVGPDHLLLGLVRQEDGAAADALWPVGVALGKLRPRVQAADTILPGIPPRHRPLTTAAKLALAQAYYEAELLGDQHTGTQHALAALTRELGFPSLALALLNERGTDPEWFRGYAAQEGQRRQPPGEGHFDRYSELSHQVVAFAQEEARTRRHSEVDTGHLLLGMLHSGDQECTRVLHEQGLTLSTLLDHFEEHLGRGEGGEPPEQAPPFARELRALFEAVVKSAAKHQLAHIEPKELLSSVFLVPGCTAQQLLDGPGKDPLAMQQWLRQWSTDQ